MLSMFELIDKSIKLQSSITWSETLVHDGDEMTVFKSSCHTFLVRQLFIHWKKMNEESKTIWLSVEDSVLKDIHKLPHDRCSVCKPFIQKFFVWKVKDEFLEIISFVCFDDCELLPNEKAWELSCQELKYSNRKNFFRIFCLNHTFA